ncbi:MAG: PAS domain S-box protein [Candidatus Margulisiibacteriota bacterium]
MDVTAQVFFFAASAVIASLFCLCAGVYTIYSASTRINAVFFILCILMSGAGISQALLVSAPTASYASFWVTPFLAFWMAAITLLLHLALLFQGKAQRYIPAVYLLPAMLLTMIFIHPSQFTAQISSEFYGFFFNRGPYYYMITLFCLLYGLTSLAIFASILMTAKEFYRRRLALVIFFSASLPMIASFIFNDLFMFLSLPPFPLAIHFAAVSTLIISSFLILYTPQRKLLKENVAEAASETSFDGIILCDIQDTINYANNSACKMIGLHKDQLLGKSIYELLISKSPLTEIRSKAGDPLTVELRSYTLENNKGYLYYIRDMSEILRSRESSKKLMSEQDLLARREKTFIALFARFIEARGTDELERLWENIVGESNEVKNILRPVFEISLKRFDLSRKVGETDEKIKAYGKILQNAVATAKEKEQELGKKLKEPDNPQTPE